MTNRLIVVGSPRIDGRSANLADLLFESCIEEFPTEEVALVPVSTLDIGGCVGCEACRVNAGVSAGQNLEAPNTEASASKEPTAKELASKEPTAKESVADDVLAYCVQDDDMLEVYPLLEAADELIVVSPVYFGSVPSQLKALLDRFQPYFWTSLRTQPKRPAVLHIVGEGGDPHGFSALIITVTSACAVAGFQLETVFDWVGCLDESGEIMSEARRIDLAKGSAYGKVAEAAHEVCTSDVPQGQVQAQSTLTTVAQAAPESASRPRLDLGNNGSRSQTSKKKPSQAHSAQGHAAQKGKGAQASKGQRNAQASHQAKGPHSKKASSKKKGKRS